MIKKILNKIRRYKYKRAISVKSVEQRFTNIYKENIWFSNKESRSGSGSTLNATETIRRTLPELIAKLNGKVLPDIGCGDFNWMKEIQLPCHYIGIDLVEDLIEENNKKFADEHREFKFCNPIENNIPSADIVLCREVLFHLSNADGKKVIKTILDSDANWLIGTTQQNIENNNDIRTGEFRNLNLQRKPFNFPEPEYLLEDNHVSKHRMLGVWDLQKLRDHH